MGNSASFAIRSENIYTLMGATLSGFVVVDHGSIKAVVEHLPEDLSLGTVYDVGSAWVFPGFIDLHIHGSGGWSVFSHNPEEIHALSRYLAAFGTTSYYPTIGTAPNNVIRASIDAVKQARNVRGGAEVLGLHMEGPFLSRTKKGAQREDHLRLPSEELVAEWQKRSEGSLKRITLAPEIEGALGVIEFLRSQDIVAAGGHTAATYDETVAAIDRGVRVANHTFNAMQEFNHRAPGALGAYLTDDRVFCELIADNIHVHRAAMKLLSRVVGSERTCLVTDAVPMAGVQAGIYRLGGREALEGREVHVTPDGQCRLPNGTIAGSTATMLGDVREYAAVCGSIETAVRAASLNPARAMGVAHRKGTLALGKDADIVVVNPDWQVSLTFVRGQLVYDAKKMTPGQLVNADMRPE